MRHHQLRGGARSPNDEISPRGRVWNRELTENRWIHLLKLVGPGMGRENLIARTARRERNRYHLLESHTIRNLRLCPFGSLAKNALANIGWAVNQYDARSSHSLRNRTTSTSTRVTSPRSMNSERA